MALRRLAQQNHASASPRSPEAGSPSLANSVNGALPFTPHNRVSFGVYRSPASASTPSKSASVPFDWEAARSHAPPPYGSPLQRKGRKSVAVSSSATGTPVRKGIIRQKGILERIHDVPSTILFHWTMFPQNIPFPSPRTSARIIGGGMHLISLFLRVSRSRSVPTWEDIYAEDELDVWWDWTTFFTICLIATSLTNVAYLFSRTKKYHLHLRHDPVSSPHATFVPKKMEHGRDGGPSIWRRGFFWLWWAFSSSWRFLLGMRAPALAPSLSNSTSKIQQLEIWTPGELELQLFSLYSPVHAFLWTATGWSNWIIMLFNMTTLTIMLNALIYVYQALIKDKEIIAAEVMNEYNQGFVYLRINPIRHDAGVMTHESEIVDIWSPI